MIQQFEKIELDLVDFETAVSLVEKGCFLRSKTSFVNVSDNQYYEINNVGFPPNIYPRPELELVSKWFMEKKDINITVNLLRNEYNSRWCYNVDHIMVDQILHRWHPKDETYLTYEKALSEAIKFCLILI